MWLIPNVVVVVLTVGMSANFFTPAGTKNHDAAHLAELGRLGTFAVGADKVHERSEHVELDVVKVVQDRVALDNAQLEHLAAPRIVTARAGAHGALVVDLLPGVEDKGFQHRGDEDDWAGGGVLRGH
jgi:hypothetical protein